MADERLDDLLEIVNVGIKLQNMAKNLESRGDINELTHLYKALSELAYIREIYYRKLGI